MTSNVVLRRIEHAKSFPEMKPLLEQLKSNRTKIVIEFKILSKKIVNNPYSDQNIQ